MNPSRPSRNCDNGGVDVAAVLIAHGPTNGQPCLYNYPPHVQGHFDRSVSYEETMNSETRFKGVAAAFDSHITSKELECSTSFVPQRRFDSNPRAVYPQKYENDGGYSFSVAIPYDHNSHSNGSHNEYLVAPQLSHSWNDAPQGFTSRRVSFDRFKGGNIETKEYMNDLQGNVAKDYFHPVPSNGIFPISSQECPPQYHFIHPSSKEFHRISTEDQIHYFIQPPAMIAANLTNHRSSSFITEQLDINKASVDSLVKVPDSIDATLFKEESAIIEKAGESTSLDNIVTNQTVDNAMRCIMKCINSREEPLVWGCTCKKSKCLKLYCQCFGSGGMCGTMCRCVSCYNNTEYEQLRKSAIKAVLSRNPNAFDKNSAAPVTVQGEHGVSVPVKSHTYSCKCRKSACLKKYCECYNAYKECNPSCRCVDCQNTPDDEPVKANEGTLVPPSTLENSSGNERIMDAVQNLALLRNNSPHRSTEVARSSPSLPSLVTMTSGVSSKDDDDSIVGMNPIPSNNRISLQGMDILAMAALSELRYRLPETLARDDCTRAQMMRSNSTSTCSMTFDDSQFQPIYNMNKQTTENRCSSEHEGLPLKKRPFYHISRITDSDHADLEAAVFVDEKSEDSSSEEEMIRGSAVFPYPKSNSEQTITHPSHLMSYNTSM